MGERAAYVFRMNPGGNNLIPQALERDLLLTGWSDLPEALDAKDRWALREMVHQKWYSNDPDYRRSGQSASDLWTFLFEMRPGDYVVVPDGPQFFIGVVGDAEPWYDSSGVVDDSAHRRSVNWLNNRKPIPRTHARSALRSRMNSYRTCTAAGDLMGEIEEVLRLDQAPSFFGDLRSHLVVTTLQRLQGGYMDRNAFEVLIKEYLLASGAAHATVVGRSVDAGVDVRAQFFAANVVPVSIGVQAKYWKDAAAISAVEELIAGLKEESIGIGMLVTTATIPDEVREAAQDLASRHGVTVICIDGQELAGLIVDTGLRQFASQD